jgi:hypothetical protein
MSWLRQLFHRDRLHDDLRAEIEDHLAEHTELLIAEGRSP